MSDAPHLDCAGALRFVEALRTARPSEFSGESRILQRLPDWRIAVLRSKPREGVHG